MNADVEIKAMTYVLLHAIDYSCSIQSCECHVKRFNREDEKTFIRQTWNPSGLYLI